MKKLTTAIIILSTLIPAIALASTNVTLTPSRTTAVVGQYFTVAVALNPSEAVYTSKVALTYTSDNIKYVSFTQGANWMPLPLSGYDEVNASTRSIIKTGGYPRGVSTPVRFGTLTFRATKAGIATISVAPGTSILNVSNQNVSSSVANTIQVVIGTSPVLVEVIEEIPTEEIATTSTSSPLSTFIPTQLLAAAAAAGSGISGWILWILFILILIAVIIYIITRRRRNQ